MASDDTYKAREARDTVATDYDGLFISRLNADGFAILEMPGGSARRWVWSSPRTCTWGSALRSTKARALEYALDASEVGCDDASLLVSLMVDAPVATDQIRELMTKEEARTYVEYSKVFMNKYRRLCVAQRPYSAPAT